jgi:hypothetical protein
MNGFCPHTSAGIQHAEFKHVFENGAMRNRRRNEHKENVMLKKFAAGLLATALIAGPAFAQSNSTPAPTAPAAQTQTKPNAPAASTTMAKPAATSTKSVKHSAKHSRKHHVRHARKHSTRTKTSARMHQSRHVTVGKTRHAGVAKSGKQS